MLLLVVNKYVILVARRLEYDAGIGLNHTVNLQKVT